MHVLVNAAMSADGKLATHRREQLRISGDADFARVDRRRAEVDAIVVGVGTVIADDPSLIRFDRERRSEIEPTGVPARVVVDSRGRTPLDAGLLSGDAPTYLLTSEATPPERRDAFRDAGARVIVAGTDRVNLPDAFGALEREGIERLLVEGGGELIFSCFEAELVDELSVYVGSLVIGGQDAPTLADGNGFVESFPALTLRGVERLGDGVLLRWRVENE
ncbi:2,5-diamino-6-(ribosylamino)-4(3H)-pyrimidinone 5'-phosphate reductase [Halocatena pleomorpha]|uniref:2,5-diamino-6-(ribosylamino)-4(3H)-pyrimidinone 5'-phosphate reductase n=1 Tax=Halocatena pleomorpha TaxID=1785090 RepID=A0A3P3RJ94_9EURY|nr:2,5-diamino-6-(ribosylamino)-4(3H)-pyrimidinone 5'-phosphate reductase [Halocatena pleomorpha]RRJ33607.1 2,5-diamino-6-(ribosylamino)-4(3H)-pyrimidinone 5'-phosphate reductase [Halocatena pleomorpha]